MFNMLLRGLYLWGYLVGEERSLLVWCSRGFLVERLGYGYFVDFYKDYWCVCGFV